jgi:hypothetical protein
MVERAIQAMGPYHAVCGGMPLCHDGGVSDAATNLPGATEAQLRRERDRLQALAAEHGLTALRVTPSGRLLAVAEEGRSYFDIVRFEKAAAEVAGASVEVIGETAGHPASKTDEPTTPL